MSVPSRAAAAALLLSLDPPPWHLRHARAVAEVAGWLAARCAGRGEQVDRALVEAAALLHDVDKVLAHDDPARALPHGEGSAAWLAALGHGELAGPIVAHPVTRLIWPGPEADAWLAAAPLEELIVAYADKRAGQHLEPMAARFAHWHRRYPDGWADGADERSRRRAAELELDVCARAGVTPREVGRLRWTSRVLATARGATAEVAA